jgi:hypothetical protein
MSGSFWLADCNENSTNSCRGNGGFCVGYSGMFVEAISMQISLKLILCGHSVSLNCAQRRKPQSSTIDENPENPIVVEQNRARCLYPTDSFSLLLLFLQRCYEGHKFQRLSTSNAPLHAHRHDRH